MVNQGLWDARDSLTGGRRWALGFAALVMLLTSLPYLLGYASQGRDWRFTGFVFGVEDGNSYIAKMQAGAAGAWLFRTPYTPAHQQGVVAYLPYLLLGKLVSPPDLHEKLVLIFHIFRLAAGMLAILAAYDFIAYFISGERERRYGLVLTVLGGGLGWVLLLLGLDTWLGSMPLEFYSPETFGFLEVFGLPHLALARAAMLWGLLVYLRSTRGSANPTLKSAAGLGLLWLLAALSQPLTALCLGAVIALHLAALGVVYGFGPPAQRSTGWVNWRGKLRFVVLAFLIPAPFILYNVISFSTDPYLKTWTDQNLIISPPLPHYLLAYGLLLPFAVLGARNLLRQNASEGWLLVAWILASPALAYAPVNLQRRLLEGLWIAVVVVALWSLRTDYQPGVRWRVFLFTTLLAFPSTLILLAGSVSAAVQPGMPMFREIGEVQVFEYLGANSDPWGVVMTSYATGNALPAWAPSRVVIGHGPESSGLEQLQTSVQRFYDASTPDSERQRLVAELNISYVFHGPHERLLGGWEPSRSSQMKEIYRQGPYAVYEPRD